MLSQSTFVPAPRWAFFCRRKSADTLTITAKETRPETCYASLRCQIGAELGPNGHERQTESGPAGQNYEENGTDGRESRKLSGA